ncbi:ABC transporter permease [Mesorhizobium sp. M7D.F.Ca.US.005.01.1.1]|uniref:ABC transporter permease n=1 Tax=Mesorhizobium sp. M7D.F.Ca.US.005.01.1.1 TaxID=2493678 RepID=UPI000F7633E4|nr:ABC transporter permease [Mesorhizobium sp. M7D.F.Ca.US.005.01.1.1]AZO41651.1 ABC transporter permease [Mesorhizobium sp. M7D.F.Ca.US.005.01.1.1]
MDLLFIRDSFVELLAGVPLTLQLTLIAFSIGVFIAVVLALMRMSGIRGLDWVARTYVFLFRGTPLLVQIFLIYYGLGQFRPTLQGLGLWQFFREPYWCAILALSLNTAAYGSEILRGALRSVPSREVEAARACGMSGLLLYRRIVLPIALRQALPAYGNELILMVKATSLASIITMMDVTGIAARLISASYRPVEVFIAAGAIYLAINFLLTRLVALLDWWLTPHLRAPPASSNTMEKVNV